MLDDGLWMCVFNPSLSIRHLRLDADDAGLREMDKASRFGKQSPVTSHTHKPAWLKLGAALAHED
jgi:hypothetical protein